MTSTWLRTNLPRQAACNDRCPHERAGGMRRRRIAARLAVAFACIPTACAPRSHELPPGLPAVETRVLEPAGAPPERGEAAASPDGSASSAAPAAVTASAVPPGPALVRLGSRIEVDLAAREIRAEAQSALDAGWLEQAVCRAGTREHESVLVVDFAPSLLHAALLMIGLEPGRPGRWELAADGRVVRLAPEGPRLELSVVRHDPAGERVEAPLTHWIRGVEGHSLPDHPWVFAGSLREASGYVADFSGSVVGLVTFGDEVIAYEEVLADAAAVDEPALLVREDRVPTPGTTVTLVIRPAR